MCLIDLLFIHINIIIYKLIQFQFIYNINILKSVHRTDSITHFLHHIVKAM